MSWAGSSTTRAGHPWRGDEQRHAHLLVVEGGAVIDAAVLAELLAVVGGDGDDERAAEHRAGVVERRGEGGVDATDAVVVLRLGGGPGPW
jgi:hypothetical protein